MIYPFYQNFSFVMKRYTHSNRIQYPDTKKQTSSLCKWILLPVCLMLPLFTGGCSALSSYDLKEASSVQKPSDSAEQEKTFVIDEDGTILIADTLKAPASFDAFTLLDHKDALAANDLFYAAWTCGEPSNYVNAEGESVDLYPGQLYVLIQNCASIEKAQAYVDAWKERTKSVYEQIEEVSLPKSLDLPGMQSLFSYSIDKENNPYQSGTSTFLVHDNQAISIELLGTKDCPVSVEEAMENFLESLAFLNE